LDLDLTGHADGCARAEASAVYRRSGKLPTDVPPKRVAGALARVSPRGRLTKDQL